MSGNDTWPCSYPGHPGDGPRFCKHQECKRRTATAPAHAGGLTDEEVIRIQALRAAADVAAPGEANTITTFRAGVFANWIRTGRNP